MERRKTNTPLVLKNLTKSYGHQRGISELNITVAAGEIFGFLGPNGAGKSTTIRTILNFQKPTIGTATVFGLDSVKDSVAVKKRLGYLAGELALYDNLTGRQFLEYLGSLGRTVDWAEVERLATRFHAELDRKLKELSKGNRQKIGLVQAFMHQPDLIILDEPTSGLDPLMQEEFFRLLDESKQRGAAIFFSSHNITEIQRVADTAGFIRDGHLIGVEDITKLRELNIHRLQVQFGHSKPDPAMMKRVKNVDEVHMHGQHGTFVITGSVSAFIKVIARFDVQSIDRQETNLEDIFLKYYQQPGKEEDA